jgi:hypothetical protein
MLMIFSRVCALLTLAFLLDAARSAATASSNGSGPQPPSLVTVTVTSYLMEEWLATQGSGRSASLIRIWDGPVAAVVARAAPGVRCRCPQTAMCFSMST